MSAIWRWGAAAILIIGINSLSLVSSYPKVAADRWLPTADIQTGTLVTIAFMGTSLTAGDPWPDLVAERLQKCTHHPVRALRFAQGGATSVWGLTQVEAVIAAAPDMVLMEFAINDADLRRGLSLAGSRDAHRAILARVKQGLPKAQVVLLTTNPALGLRRLLRPRLPAYYALYHRLAVDHWTGLVDLTPRWLAMPDMVQALTDGLHPSPKATAEVVVPAITSYLARVLGDQCGA